MINSHNCDCCKHFYPFDFSPSPGECRYNPPVADKDSNGKYSRTYPICYPSDGCQTGWEQCEPYRHYQQDELVEAGHEEFPEWLKRAIETRIEMFQAYIDKLPQGEDIIEELNYILSLKPSEEAVNV